VFILDSISNYTPKDEREAQSICERVTPRLAHANAAVVLSAVKVRALKACKNNCTIMNNFFPKSPQQINNEMIES